MACIGKEMLYTGFSLNPKQKTKNNWVVLTGNGPVSHATVPNDWQRPSPPFDWQRFSLVTHSTGPSQLYPRFARLTARPVLHGHGSR